MSIHFSPYISFVTLLRRQSNLCSKYIKFRFWIFPFFVLFFLYYVKASIITCVKVHPNFDDKKKKRRSKSFVFYKYHFFCFIESCLYSISNLKDDFGIK